MARSTGFLMQAGLVLALTASASIVLGCDISLKESLDGDFAYIKIGDQAAILQNGFNDVWLSHVKSDGKIIKNDNTGVVNVTAIADMSEDEQAVYLNFFDDLERFNGISLESVNDNVEISNFERGTYSLEKANADGTEEKKTEGDDILDNLVEPITHLGKPIDVATPGRTKFLKDSLYAVLNADEQTVGFNHALFFFAWKGASGPVAVVDKKCTELKFLPAMQLKAELEK